MLGYYNPYVTGTSIGYKLKFLFPLSTDVEHAFNWNFIFKEIKNEKNLSKFCLKKILLHSGAFILLKAAIHMFNCWATMILYLFIMAYF